MSKWNIDPDHSVVAFSIQHMMIAHVHGQFNKISGSVQYNPSHIEKTSMEFKIDVDSIITGIQKRDDHLKSEDFFHKEAHPEIVFKGSQAERAGFNICKITGNLTIHGVTKAVTVDVELLGSVKSPFGETSMGFTAKTKLNREDFGITWNEPMESNGYMVGKDVMLFIDIEADLEE